VRVQVPPRAPLLMNPTNKHIRHGVGTVRPFLYGRLDLLDFVKQVFGGVELERNIVPGGFQVQTLIGDAVVVMAAMDPPYSAATRASVYVYVDNVDAVYAGAIAAGATSISEPTDKPFQERNAGVKDSFGNIWYIATYTGDAAN
jgi:PhnB protein